MMGVLHLSDIKIKIASNYMSFYDIDKETLSLRLQTDGHRQCKFDMLTKRSFQQEQLVMIVRISYYYVIIHRSIMKITEGKIVYIFLSNRSVLTFVLGAQKNRLNERVR